MDRRDKRFYLRRNIGTDCAESRHVDDKLKELQKYWLIVGPGKALIADCERRPEQRLKSMRGPCSILVG
jgi:hypothetical protein